MSELKPIIDEQRDHEKRLCRVEASLESLQRDVARVERKIDELPWKLRRDLAIIAGLIIAALKLIP